MPPKIILLRSMDMLPDPRVEKYVRFYHENNLDYQLVGWNRANEKQEKKHTLYFDCPSRYGAGVKNLKNLLLFNVFLLKTLWKQRITYHTIHACDLDTVMPALFIKLFLRKNVIFDVFDWYSDSRIIPATWFRLVVSTCERLAVHFSDYVILCDEERVRQIPFPFDKKKMIVLPNIPQFESFPTDTKYDTDRPFTISYVGILSTHRGLEDLLEVVSKCGDIRLSIAGFGELEPLVGQYSANHNQIRYLGKLAYADGLALMQQSDLIVAMYYKSIRNHIYAAPNKYYEALFLGKPLLTTVGTLIGAKTEKYQTGFAIEEGKDAILECLLHLKQHQLDIKAANAHQLWMDTYQTLWKDTINSSYRKAIKKHS